MLENEADVNLVCTSSNSSALHENDDEEKLKILIEFGANVNAIDNQGFTPLHSISLKGDVNCAKLLIENGANVNAKDNDGQTPLMNAAKQGNVEFLQLLIEKNANLEVTDNSGRTALQFVEEMLENDCDNQENFRRCFNLLTEFQMNDFL